MSETLFDQKKSVTERFEFRVNNGRNGIEGAHSQKAAVIFENGKLYDYALPEGLDRRSDLLVRHALAEFVLQYEAPKVDSAPVCSKCEAEISSN